MKTAFDAIVIGAGPAGSATAILLAQAGWRVVLLEKQSFPRRKVCGECIAASNFPLLDALGIGATFAALAGPSLREMMLMSGMRTVRAPLPSLPVPGQRWGRALGRETLDALLLERATGAGVLVLQPWKAAALEGGPGNWRCHARAVPGNTDDPDGAGFVADRPDNSKRGSQRTMPADDEHGNARSKPRNDAGSKAKSKNRSEDRSHQQNQGDGGAPVCNSSGDVASRNNGDLNLTAPVMIAAHGSWGPVVGAAPARAPRASDLFAFKANFLNTSLEPGVLPILAFSGGYGGMVVADNDVTTLACCIRRDALQAWRSTTRGIPAGDAMEAFLKLRCRGVRDALAGADRAARWLAVGPLRPGIRLGNGNDRRSLNNEYDPEDNTPFLAGNAAGEAHPIIGEGISMALQSGFLLASMLTRSDARKLSPPLQRQLMRAYARAWRGHFAGRLRLAAGFAHLAMRPALAPGLLPLLSAAPGLLTHAARLSGKTRQLSCVPYPDPILQGHHP